MKILTDIDLLFISKLIKNKQHEWNLLDFFLKNGIQQKKRNEKKAMKMLNTELSIRKCDRCESNKISALLMFS